MSVSSRRWPQRDVTLAAGGLLPRLLRARPLLVLGPRAPGRLAGLQGLRGCDRASRRGAVPRLRGRLSAGCAARLRAAVALRRLPRRVRGADGVLRRRPRGRRRVGPAGCGVRRRALAGARGVADPLALRPVAGAARCRRARRPARAPASARLGSARGRDRGEAVAGGPRAAGARLGGRARTHAGGARRRRHARRLRRPLRDPGAARPLRQRARAGRPAAADREPRRVARDDVRPSVDHDLARLAEPRRARRPRGRLRGAAGAA